jgi:hypothetical protein
MDEQTKNLVAESRKSCHQDNFVGQDSSYLGSVFLVKLFWFGKIGKIYMFLTCGQLNITPKNRCANPTPGMLAVKIYMSQRDYPKSTRFYFVAI